MINAAALDLIKRSEGWVNHAYPDPGTGGEPLTIGYGHTSAAGAPRVTAGMTISLEEGDAILQSDLKAVEASVDRLVTVPLNENQRGALVSFVFNVGSSSFATSTLLRKLNARDYNGAVAEFARWNHAGNTVLPGLTTRRAAEAKLFTTPAVGPVPSPVPTPAPTPSPKPAGSIWAAIIEIVLAIFSAFKKR